jgi:tetratricopeptide (TPR) repeat protein
MSLLLEALKKAERAKEEAQRRARGESGEAADAPGAQPTARPARGGELTLEGHSAPEPEAKRVMTRAELPDISATLDIASDDLGEKAPPRPRDELRLETPREPLRRGTPTFFQAGVQPGRQPPAQPAPQTAERATARKVFEAKFKEPNPKLPFYLTLAALSVFSVGVVVYFWYQLRPPYPLVNTNPQRQSAEAQVAAAAQAPVRPAVSSTPAAAASSIPGLPGNPPASQPAIAVAQAPARAASTPPVERPILSPAPRLAAPSVNAPPASAPARPTTEVSVSRAVAQIHPRVAAGYAAYQAADLPKARAEYEQALADEPGNRDALLGLAAVETRSGRFEAAEAQYLRLLQFEPRDPHAQAGLLTLRGARGDPLASESRVKSMLAQDPGSHVLNFALGNQFAQQGRWPEAQQEYFKAFAGDPENADFAYNLAVSLDHLRQRRLARDYYLRASALADKRGASFDPASARLRADQLAN